MKKMRNVVKSIRASFAEPRTGTTLFFQKIFQTHPPLTLRCSILQSSWGCRRCPSPTPAGRWPSARTGRAGPRARCCWRTASTPPAPGWWPSSPSTGAAPAKSWKCIWGIWEGKWGLAELLAMQGRVICIGLNNLLNFTVKKHVHPIQKGKFPPLLVCPYVLVP